MKPEVNEKKKEEREGAQIAWFREVGYRLTYIGLLSDGEDGSRLLFKEFTKGSVGL